MLIYKEVAITSLDIKLSSGELFPCHIALSFVPLRGFGHQFFVFLQTCRPRRRCEDELPHPDFVRRGCLWVQLRFKFATPQSLRNECIQSIFRESTNDLARHLRLVEDVAQVYFIHRPGILDIFHETSPSL